MMLFLLPRRLPEILDAEESSRSITPLAAAFIPTRSPAFPTTAALGSFFLFSSTCVPRGQEEVDMIVGLTDAQAGKIAEHLKLSPDGPSYEAVRETPESEQNRPPSPPPRE